MEQQPPCQQLKERWDDKSWFPQKITELYIAEMIKMTQLYIALLQDGTPGEPSVDPPGLWLQHKRGQ